MQETLLILTTLDRWSAKGEAVALATVVRTSGSTYRKEGAKMLIGKNGETVGTISAGCLEGDVMEIVPEVSKSGEPRLLRYDNTAPEDIVWGLGLGCNGIVEVLVKPIANNLQIYQTVKKSVEREQAVALATVVTSQAEGRVKSGAHMIIFREGAPHSSLGDSALDKAVIKDALSLLAQEKSQTLSYKLANESQVDVYVESFLPPPSLVIIGGDPDAVPIVRLGKQLGFKVILVDHRERFANSQRYPEANATTISRPEELHETVSFDKRSFVIVKTHNYLQDKEILKTVLQSEARYVGQLGPKARADDLLKDLKKEGISFSEDQLAKLYAPVGLDIGAEDPDQIAASILAEILAVRAGRNGGFLRNQVEAIHPRQEFTKS